jgi:hypothetical protein
VNLSLEVDYSAIHPDDSVSSRWNFRVYVTPVIPTFIF